MAKESTGWCCLAADSNDVDGSSAAPVSVGRLGPKEIGRLLVEAFRSERLADELGFRIAMKSDGNPYFIFEILRGLREGSLLTQRDDGTWAITLDLPPGRYEYKFVVDGQWCCEPGCDGTNRDCPKCVPNAFGTMNRFVEVPV